MAGVGAIAKGRGRKPWLAEGTVAEVVRVTLTEVPTRTPAETETTLTSQIRDAALGRLKVTGGRASGSYALPNDLTPNSQAWIDLEPTSPSNSNKAGRCDREPRADHHHLS